MWERVLDAGGPFGIQACGLAARDTLRLEAGLCLYGNELNENITPIEARLEFGVKFDQREFIGKDALLRQAKEGVAKVRVGLKVTERGIPREGMKVSKENKKIGFVTSGTSSPMLKTGITLAYVPPHYTSAKANVDVEIRGRRVKLKSLTFLFAARKEGNN